MPIALALTETNRSTANSAAIARWQDDAAREGYTPKQHVVPATLSVAEVAKIVSAECPANTGSHLQIFGHVAVPKNVRNPDGHGYRPGDCDARYGTDDEASWQPQPDGSYALSYWPSSAVRTISRHDYINLPGDETALFDRALQRNHDYRTGAFAYSAGGIVDNRDDYLDGTVTPRVVSEFAAVVNAENVVDVTRQYADDTFFERYAGLTALFAYLASGGDPYRQSDNFLGHEYYLDLLSHVVSGRVQMGAVRVFCSYGWEFDRWPLLRAILAGGSIWTLYDVFAQADLSQWSASQTIGETVRRSLHTAGAQTLDTIMGDGTLKLMATTPGPSMADFVALQGRVTAVETVTAQVPTLQSDYATIQQQVTALSAGGGSSAGQTGSGTPTAPVIINGSFDLPALAAGTYQSGPVPGWGTTGYVAHTGQPWTNPPGATAQALALTAKAQATQTLNNLVIGQLYTIPIKAIQRPAAFNPGGNQTVNVFVDGVLVSNLAPGAAWQAYNLTFNAKSASQVLKLAGTSSGDATVYLTGIDIS